MSSAMYERMRVNPKFQELVAKRGRFAWTLAFIVLITAIPGTGTLAPGAMGTTVAVWGGGGWWAACPTHTPALFIRTPSPTAHRWL